MGTPKLSGAPITLLNDWLLRVRVLFSRADCAYFPTGIYVGYAMPE